MKKLIILGAAGVLLFLLALSAVQSSVDRLRGPSWGELERERLAVERAAALAPWQTAAGAALALAPAVAVYVLIGLAAAGGAAALARFLRRIPYERPDAAGRLPVLLTDQYSAQRALLDGFHVTERTRAAIGPVPHSLTYSPHSAPRLDYRADAGRAAVLPADEPTGQLGTVPSFSELLSQGRIGRGNPMLLGFDGETGAAVEGSWLDLYSCAVGGLSGSGKSWTACFLAAQAALYGSRIVLLDPHAENAESLTARLGPMASRFVCAPASTPAEMLAAVKLAAGELERRKAGRRGDPWLIIADEFSALQRGALAEPLAALVEGLGQEGRKLGLYGLVCGQVWTATRAGGSELRDSLASAYVHRLRPAQARYLTGLTADDLPSDLLELPAGGAYLLSTAGELRRVTIPQMAPDDVARVAQLLDGAADTGFPQASTGRLITPPAYAWRKPDGSLMVANDAQATSASGRGAAPSAEAQQAAALFLDGEDLAALVYQLRGVKSSEGRRYQTAAIEVQALLREGLGGAA